jgi:capsular exopolysaccharide synthesis family protein
MGKVYKALTKAERERDRSVLASLTGNGANPSSQKRTTQNAEQFDFIDYSLSAPPASEIEGRATATRSQVELALPAREVNLDLARIDPHLISFYDFDPKASEQYTKLAVALISGASERPLKRVLVASAEHGEGRTCVTLNLACALASAKQRVLVIDGDLNRPSVLRLLVLESPVGLAETLGQHMPPGAAALRVQPSGFDILPTRERVDNPAELLASPSFVEMLESLDSSYDFILFDSSPLTTAAEPSLLVRITDATLLVVRAGKTSSLQMAKAIAPLSEESIFGVVLNRATA